MADLAPTRRALLAGIAAVPALAVAGCPSSAPAAPSGAIARAIASAHAAEEAYETYWRNVYDPLDRTYKARAAALPPVVIDYREEGDVTVHRVSSDDRWSMMKMTRIEQKRPDARNESDALREACGRLRDGIDRRDAEVERIGAELGVGNACDRQDALGDQACAAVDAVLATAPVSLCELADKLAFMLGNVGDLDRAHVEIIAADVRRLGGAA